MRMQVRGTVTRPGRREHYVTLDKPYEGIKTVIIGYMAGVKGLVLGQEVDWDCEVLHVGPSAIFVSEVK